MNLKLRLTLWYALFFVLLSSGSLALLFSIGTKQARSSLEGSVVRLAEAGVRELEFEHDALEMDDDVPLVENGVFLCAFDAEGTRLLGALPSGFPSDAAPSPGALSEIIENGTSYYYYDSVANIKHFGDVTLRAAASLTEAESSIASLLRLALVALPFLAVTAAVGGYLIARQSLKPLNAMAETAKRIGESGDLSARIGLSSGHDEVHVLSRAFDGMCNRLETAFEKEKRFTSDASHELRTPTAVILSQCEYAEDRPGEAQAAIAVIHRQAKKMTALIGQLLLLARGERKDFQRADETLNLSELTEMVAAEQEELALRKNISFHLNLQPDCLTRGDESMLMRLLINLTENAVRYGREGGNVFITLFSENNLLHLSVRDDGIGMEKAELSRIFERFYQADPSRSGEGAGLGLSMAESIVGAHGGSIRAESEPGRGSTFFVTLPGYGK